jgi:uncharacterized protein (DUF58 family)
MSERAIRQRAEHLASTLPPLLVAAERVAATVAQGVHGRRRVGSGETFWQFRRYQHGDGAQAIDWRQSAKTDRLFVRQNEWEAAQNVWLWRDSSPSMRYQSRFGPCEKLERASLLLLAIAALLVRGGERIARLTPEGVDGGTPATGQAALTRMAEGLMLDSQDTAAGASIPPIRRLPRHAHVVFFGDFLGPIEEIDAVVREYAEAGVQGHLVQVLDPSEEDLPFSGRTQFQGTEGEGSLIVGRAQSLRQEYHQRFSSHAEALQHLTMAAGWSHTVHRTETPPQSPLLGLYQAVAEGLA